MSLTAAETIARLDDGLVRAGGIITLRRVVGTRDPVNVDVDLPAGVRGGASVEIGGGIYEGGINVILSPTGIAAAGWPGTDETLPKRMDRVIFAGAVYTVGPVTPFFMGETLVRIELSAKGPG
jgi:hypothetical protein